MEELKSKIIEMVDRGVKKPVIKRELKLSKDKLKNILDSIELENNILDMRKRGVSVLNISKKLNISRYLITKLIISKNSKVGNLNIKSDRNEKIIERIKDGVSYTKIAKEFNITKVRVQQICKRFYDSSYSKWEDSRIKHENTIENIIGDYNNGLSYDELNKKYDLRYFKKELVKKGIDLYKSTILSDKYKKIKELYLSNTAIDIVKKHDVGIKSLSNIYKICDNKYEKYNKNEVISIIKKLKDVDKISFVKISSYLNENNYKTIRGKDFTNLSVWYMYHKNK